jgi:hypothetical protein
MEDYKKRRRIKSGKKAPKRNPRTGQEQFDYYGVTAKEFMEAMRTGFFNTRIMGEGDNKKVKISLRGSDITEILRPDGRTLVFYSLAVPKSDRS